MVISTELPNCEARCLSKAGTLFVSLICSPVFWAKVPSGILSSTPSLGNEPATVALLLTSIFNGVEVGWGVGVDCWAGFGADEGEELGEDCDKGGVPPPPIRFPFH